MSAKLAGMGIALAACCSAWLIAGEIDHDKPAPPGVHPELKKGAKGEEVKLLQQLLNQMVAPSPALQVDGDFGGGTETAVAAFQKSKGLPADGVVGTASWKALANIEVQAQVSTTPQALFHLRRLLDQAGLKSGTITSGIRTAIEQARVMFDNLEKHGVEHQRKLYGANGDKVIDVYVKHRGQPRDEVIGHMKDEIKKLGPGNVSKHSSDDRHVIDVAPSSIRDEAKFLAAVEWGKGQGFILHFIPPPKDPAYHLEFKK